MLFLANGESTNMMIALEWYCDIDIDTVRSNTEVLGMVNDRIGLASNPSRWFGCTYYWHTQAIFLRTSRWGQRYTWFTGLCTGETRMGRKYFLDMCFRWVLRSYVETYITNETINWLPILKSRQWDPDIGFPIRLEWLDNLPWTADGDDNTSSDKMGGYVETEVNCKWSQVNNRAIVGQPSLCSDGQVLVYNSTSNDWECGDDTDTTLTPTKMKTDWGPSPTCKMFRVNGENVLVESSTLVKQSGWFRRNDRTSTTTDGS